MVFGTCHEQPLYYKPATFPLENIDCISAISMFNSSQPALTNLSHCFPNQFHHPTDPNNPYVPVPQPLIPSAIKQEPHIHPPGTNPYANFESHPLSHVGFQAQASFVQDLNVGSQNWVINEAAPIRYDAVSG